MIKCKLEGSNKWAENMDFHMFAPSLLVSHYRLSPHKLTCPPVVVEALRAHLDLLEPLAWHRRLAHTMRADQPPALATMVLSADKVEGCVAAVHQAFCGLKNISIGEHFLPKYISRILSIFASPLLQKFRYVKIALNSIKKNTF